MIKRIKISKHLINSLYEYLKSHNIAKRHTSNGSKRNQLVGLIGECETIRFLTGAYPNLRSKEDGFDGGYDIDIYGKKIDIKCMERRSYVMNHYVHNFYLLQKDHAADTLLFTSLNSKDMTLEICGWIPKTELIEKADFYQAGTIRERSDGSYFTLKDDNYEILNSRLHDIIYLNA